MAKTSQILTHIHALVVRDHVRVSDHGYEELAEDDILATDVVAGVATAIAVEEYPTRTRGPTVLVLQQDARGRPIHVVWGIPKDQEGPAVLVTAYRPDPAKWEVGFRRRRKA